MATFQVDHVIPESLHASPDRVNEILGIYGLPGSFDLNSFENWMPACASCNRQKSDAVFEEVPIIAAQLRKAREKADDARELAAEVKSSQQVGRAITILEDAFQRGQLDSAQINNLKPLIEFHESHRESENVGSPAFVGPEIGVVSEHGNLIVTKGPFGIGVGPDNPSSRGGFRCGVCGNSAWNGARCVVCGNMEDD